MTHADKPTPDLYGLATETRQMIFDYLAIAEKDLRGSTLNKHEHSKLPWTNMKITCKQFHAEMRGNERLRHQLFLEQNMFVFQDIVEFGRISKQIPARVLARLCKVGFLKAPPSWWPYHPRLKKTGMAALRALPNLQVLRYVGEDATIHQLRRWWNMT